MARRTKRSNNTGSIVPLGGGKFAMRWREWVFDKDGRRKRKMCYETLGVLDRSAAEQRLLEKLLEVRKQKQPVHQIVGTYRDLAQRWERDILPMYKFSTRDVRKQILNARLVPRFGDDRLSAITTADAQRFVTEMRESDLAPATIHAYFKVLKGTFASAVDWHLLRENPAIGVKLPRLKAAREKWALTPEQAGALLGKLNTKVRAMIGLALISGMRRGELLAFRWGHLDDQTATIHVSEAAYRGHVGTPKTDAGVRSIPIDEWLLDLLNTWRLRSKRTRPEDFVFSTRTGGLENPNNILRRSVFPACERLKIPRATWLTFRYTFSTMAHEKGVPAKTVAVIMGHVKVDTQFEYYTQPVKETTRVAAERVSKELSRNFVQIEQLSIPYVN
jgi:integrase